MFSLWQLKYECKMELCYIIFFLGSQVLIFFKMLGNIKLENLVT